MFNCSLLYVLCYKPILDTFVTIDSLYISGVYYGVVEGSTWHLGQFIDDKTGTNWFSWAVLDFLEENKNCHWFLSTKLFGHHLTDKKYSDQILSHRKSVSQRNFLTYLYMKKIIWHAKRAKKSGPHIYPRSPPQEMEWSMPLITCNLNWTLINHRANLNPFNNYNNLNIHIGGCQIYNVDIMCLSQVRHCRHSKQRNNKTLTLNAD